MAAETYVLLPRPCPVCGYVCDRATAVTGNESPQPGDWTVCLRCGEILRFDEQLTHRQVTLEELRLLPRSDRALLFRASRMARERKLVPYTH